MEWMIHSAVRLGCILVESWSNGQSVELLTDSALTISRLIIHAYRADVAFLSLNLFDSHHIDYYLLIVVHLTRHCENEYT